MFDIEGIWESEKKLKMATGLGKIEIEEIYQDFEKELQNIRQKKLGKVNLGRPSKLSTRNIFLMLMIFIRHYLTFDFLSLLFGIDTSNVKRSIDSSFMALGRILVKKNFHHLISLNQKKFSESDLKKSEKFILMELNNLSEDHLTK